MKISGFNVWGEKFQKVKLPETIGRENVVHGKTLPITYLSNLV